jgi:hypothetical protein
MKTQNNGLGTAFVYLRCRLHHLYIAARLSKSNYDALHGDKPETEYIRISLVLGFVSCLNSLQPSRN